jgi:hypothetical protein
LDVLGFIFGIAALGAAGAAKAQVAALKKEVDALKALVQGQGEGPKGAVG